MINLYKRRNSDEAEPVHEPEIQNPASGKLKVSIPKISKYEDPTREFTTQELRWSFWYVRHKVVLYRLILIALVLTNVGFLAFGVWKWGLYILGIDSNRRLEQSLTASINYTGIHAHFAAQPIQILNTQVFSSRENKFDAVAELANPNKQFLVKFSYYFVIGDTKTVSRSGFLLPGETRPVATLGIEKSALGTPSLVLESISYSRISNQQAADPIGFQAYRLNFTASDFIFLKSLAQEGNNADAIQFKLTNGSPYSYVNVDLYVALLQNGQMVGILPLHLDKIDSLETKNIDLRSLLPGLNVNRISVFPMINVYDAEVYAS